ncbi:MAG: Ig-like domain-containing protein [Steroidobacteraceae bacterium]
MAVRPIPRVTIHAEKSIQCDGWCRCTGAWHRGRSADGHVTYTPAADFSGTDSFTYLIADNQGRSAGTAAHVTVKVAAARGDTPTIGHWRREQFQRREWGRGAAGGGGSIDSLLLGVLAATLTAAVQGRRKTNSPL